MNRRLLWAVAGVLSWGFLAGSESQVAQAGWGSLLSKEVAATTRPSPSPTTVPAAAQGKSSAELLLGDTISPTTRPATNPSADSLTAQATAKLDEAIAYIKANKLDLADKLLTQLEEQKALLPVSLQGRLTDARTLLENVKGGALPAGLSLPKW